MLLANSNSPKALFDRLAFIVAPLAMISVLHHEGRVWWCSIGDSSLVSLDAWGPHNSQHLFDPYSLSHVLHGIIFYFALTNPLWSVPTYLQLGTCLVAEALWEILENSPIIIDRYRVATAALGYSGDSIANSIGDLISCVAGFFLARALQFKKSLILFFFVEIVLLLWIKDNLTLNVIMLVHPIETIRVWQTRG